MFFEALRIQYSVNFQNFCTSLFNFWEESLHFNQISFEHSALERNLPLSSTVQQSLCLNNPCLICLDFLIWVNNTKKEAGDSAFCFNPVKANFLSNFRISNIPVQKKVMRSFHICWPALKCWQKKLWTFIWFYWTLVTSHQFVLMISDSFCLQPKLWMLKENTI